MEINLKMKLKVETQTLARLQQTGSFVTEPYASRHDGGRIRGPPEAPLVQHECHSLRRAF